MKFLLAFSFVLILSYGCGNSSDTIDKDAVETMPATPAVNYAVKSFFPHDTSLFTEGFLMHDGKLFESTGSPDDRPQARSLIGVIDLATGKLDIKVELDKSKYFGEGIVFLNGKLYQLTYTSQVGFIYDSKSFKQLGTFSYANKQGWSLTTNGSELIMSDGTSQLTFLDTQALKPIKKLAVTENGLPLEKLNELEWINGFIYANIWLTNFIVKIDPANGRVVGKLDLASLAFEAKNKNPASDVLNGIAYDAAEDKIYVTGKLWPNIYEITFPH